MFRTLFKHFEGELTSPAEVTSKATYSVQTSAAAAPIAPVSSIAAVVQLIKTYNTQINY